MLDPLTKRQAQILEFITKHITENNFAPSYREIGAHFGLSSTATIAEHIESLRNKGYLTLTENSARSIQPSNPDEDSSREAYYSIPLLGFVAAGKPIEATVSNETIDIPKDMMGKNVFALKVKGESMIEDGILSGDYIILEQSRTAKNGEIVVALVNHDQVTLKRFYKEKDKFRLQPANSTMEPIYLKEVSIQGRVRGLIRKFC